MGERVRRQAWWALEALERRELLSFDPGKAGAIQHLDFSRFSSTSADSFYLENRRIGYMAADLDGVVVETSNSPADPQPYVGGARFFIKPSSVNAAPIGTLTLRNAQAKNITAAYYWDRNQGAFDDVHTDGVWYMNVVSQAAEEGSIFVFDDVSVEEIEGHEAFHYEGGSARRIWFRNTYAHNEITKGGARYTFKINPGQVIRELIFDNADLQASDYTRQLDNISFEWQAGTNPANAAMHFPAIWVNNDGTAGITREYVIAKLKGSGVPDAVAQSIVRSGLPADLSFRRAPINIGAAGRIQAEDFDFGRQGMAYYDTTRGNDNSGQAEYRTDVLPGDDLAKVDIRTSSDAGGGYEVTAVRAGEWLTYTILVPVSGMYQVDARVQAGAVGAGGTFAIEFDGTISTGEMTVPGTGAWSTQSGSVYLPAGVHVMRLAANTSGGAAGWNLNWIELTQTAEAPAVGSPTELKALAEPWGLFRRDSSATRTPDAWGGQVRLSWRDGVGEDGYRIERSRDGLTWTTVGRNAANVTTFSDTGVKGLAGLKIDQGVQPNTTYYYRITALSSKGNRISDVIRLTTPDLSYTAKATAPTELTAIRCSTSTASGAVELSWTNNGDTTKGFYIERRVAGTSAFTRLQAMGATGGVNTYIDRDSAMAAGTSYEYRVIAYNWLGNSTPSNTASVTLPATITAPAAPSNVSATALGNGSVKIIFTDHATNEAMFEIRRPSDGFVFATVPAEPGSGGTVTVWLSGLTTPNTYVFQVRAKNVDLLADSAATASVFVAAQPAPSAAPTHATAYAVGTAASPGIELWWNGVTNEVTADVAAYKVERSIDGETWSEVGTIPANGKGQYSFTDKGLAGRTRYYYRVRSFNKAGGSSRAELSTIVRGDAGGTPAKTSGAPFSTGQIIQAEDFDRGGEGVGYHDATAGNSGGYVYRKKPDGNGGQIADPMDEGVDIALNGTIVGIDQASAGEWLRYTLTAPRSGVYRAEFSVASTGGGTFHLEIDGVDRTGPISVGSGSGWRTVVAENISLYAGEHVLRLVMDANGTGGAVGDFDWFRLVERVALRPDLGKVRLQGNGGDDRFHVRIRPDGLMEFREGATAAGIPLILSPEQFDSIEAMGGVGDDTVYLEGTAGADVLTVDEAGAAFVRMPAIRRVDLERLAILASGGEDTVLVSGGAIHLDGARAWEAGSILSISGGVAYLDADAGSETSRLLTVNVNGAGQAVFRATQHLAGLHIGTDGLATVEGDGKALVVEALSIATDGNGAYTGTLDLMQSDLIVLSDAIRREEVFASVIAMIRSGRDSAGQLWEGKGITSSSSRGTTKPASLTGLGAILNSDAGGPICGSFAGQSVDANSILVKHTWNGDVNFDGVINLTDYFRIDLGYLAQANGYRNGDVNYDGEVNMADYFLADSAYLGQKATLPAPSGGTSGGNSATAKKARYAKIIAQRRKAGLQKRRPRK